MTVNFKDLVLCHRIRYKKDNSCVQGILKIKFSLEWEYFSIKKKGETLKKKEKKREIDLSYFNQVVIPERNYFMLAVKKKLSSFVLVVIL